MVGVEKTRQLVQRLLVHPPFELDDGVKRHPVGIPAPGVEFGTIAGAQRNVGVPANQAEQKPDLLLPAVTAAPFASYPMRRHVISQPVLGSPQNADMLGQQTDLFMQLPVHCLLGRFAPLDAALRELP
jgi:hypothetical protein